MSGEKPLVDKLITSQENLQFRSYRDALAAKGIKRQGVFVVSGFRIVKDFLTNHLPDALEVLLPEKADDFVREIKTIEEQAANTKRLKFLKFSRELFAELDVFGTGGPLLVLRKPELELWNPDSETQGLEILCALGDPSNVGALLRSAAAFGAERVVLLKESASPFLPKATRAASAATLQVPLVQGPSVTELQNVERLIALDMHGHPLPEFHWPRRARILIGEEGQGVPASLEAKRLTIPHAQQVESLNAAVAAGIAMYSYRSQHIYKAQERVTPT